jgi:hypothetical protein
MGTKESLLLGKMFTVLSFRPMRIAHLYDIASSLKILRELGLGPLLLMILHSTLLILFTMGSRTMRDRQDLLLKHYQSIIWSLGSQIMLIAMPIMEGNK